MAGSCDKRGAFVLLVAALLLFGGRTALAAEDPAK